MSLNYKLQRKCALTKQRTHGHNENCSVKVVGATSSEGFLVTNGRIPGKLRLVDSPQFCCLVGDLAQVLTSRMPFLSPNEHCRSTEGKHQAINV